jgi:hypothetical protein
MAVLATKYDMHSKPDAHSNAANTIDILSTK